MCGIAGVWNRSGEPVDPAILNRMGLMLRHRGPDGDGMLLRGDVGFVHRRLTILDPSERGGQPMSLPDESVWINYNGEIHNYVELRRQLEENGAVFRSEGDTEVALWAYRVWGLECFERFNGMWALALWDSRTGALVLSRDRFGIKPLYYSQGGDRIAFASEAKSILAVCPEECQPDYREIYSFLAGGYPDVGEATFFSNIRAVPAATYMVFRRDAYNRRIYWGFRAGNEHPRADAEERFRELLDDAVRLRMRSDVPVAAAVSGGLDSTAIVRLAARHAAGPIECFSLRYDDDPQVDESGYASLAADDPARFRIHWVRPTGGKMLDTMASIVWHHDAPTPARGRYAGWFVMREVGQHAKVVLDGTGSDEQLAGYPHFVVPYLLDRLQHRPSGAFSWSMLGREARELAILRPSATIPRTLATPVKRWLGLESRSARRICRQEFVAAYGPAPHERFLDTWLRHDVDRPFRSHLNNALWTEFRHVGLSEALHAGDALSMAFSVEARAPFMDHRLVEFCFSLPFHEKIRDGWTKSILRRALADVLPEPIRTRRQKLGFPAPIRRWMRQAENFRDIQALLLDTRCLARGIFDGRSLERRLRRFGAAGPTTLGANLVWRWATLELWFRRFIDEPPDPAVIPTGSETIAAQTP